MIVKPKTRGFICTTAHPVGCARHVADQIAYVKAQGAMTGCKNVLVVGCSTGFGLATRIAAAFGCGAKTIGVSYDHPASGKRTGTPGWYNNAAFETYALEDGLYAKTLIGDAFSQEMKEQAAELIQKDLGQIDLLVYSVAAPRRTDAEGRTYSSVLKPVGAPFKSRSIDLSTNHIKEVSIEPASGEEVAATVKVMGGEDWQLWIDLLKEKGLLAQSFATVAYSYIGPEVTHAIYKNGSIGQAKKDLQETALRITEQLSAIGGKAFISVNKALVTQASAAIPVVPLYISILFHVMKEQGTHEGCIEQMDRLLRKKLFASPIPVDEENRIRMDDWEMDSRVQSAVDSLWNQVTDENLKQYADLDGYWKDFYQLFGFGIDGVDYDADVDVDVKIPSVE